MAVENTRVVNSLFDLLDQLTTLSASSVALLQGISGASLLEVPSNTAWTTYKAEVRSGVISQVDYRAWPEGGVNRGPILVIEVRGTVASEGDLVKKYGELIPTDVSGHHPDYVGYSFVVNGRCVSAHVDDHERILGVAIDYSLTTAVAGTPYTVSRICHIRTSSKEGAPPKVQSDDHVSG